MEPTNKRYTLAEATRKMEGFCAYQERCHKEVRERLREMRMIPEAIDKVMVQLIEHQYLNEERFARAFARGKFHQKHWGRNRIRQELKKREISPLLIRLALGELDSETYAHTLHELAEKRVGQLQEKDPLKRKKKLADYLLYRGWESELVYEKVRELLD